MGSTARHPLVDQAYQTRRDGDRRGALRLYLEAAQVLEGDDATALASALRHAADLHKELGEHGDAWARYEEAWSLYQAMAPAPALDVANCRRPMALWQERHGAPATALRMWREARDWYERPTGYDLQPAFDECNRHIAALLATGAF